MIRYPHIRSDVGFNILFCPKKYENSCNQNIKLLSHFLSVTEEHVLYLNFFKKAFHLQLSKITNHLQQRIQRVYQKNKRKHPIVTKAATNDSRGIKNAIYLLVY